MTTEPQLHDAPPSVRPDGPLVEVTGLRVAFGEVAAVRGLSFALAAGECLALVGESGSGKSVTARSLVGLAGRGARVSAERLAFAGTDLRGLGERQWRRIRGRRIGLVHQDALVSLDPLRTAGAEIAEPLRTHRLVSRSGVAERVRTLLTDVGIADPDRVARQRPFRLSGGQRQRALTASAIAAGPELLVADEPTTALDVTVQARVLDLLAELKSRGTALLLVSHDLAVVARIADRIAVLSDGEIVEQGPAHRVLTEPAHAVTRELLAAVPTGRPAARAPVTGEPLLEVAGVGKRFRDPGGAARTVVDDVSLIVRRGEVVGLVGESGSGKTTTARIALGLEEPDSGEVRLAGRRWSGRRERDRRALRRTVQLVPQDPLSSFDPRHTVAAVLGEAIGGRGRAVRRARAAELLAQVGLDESVLDRRPRELSGGQRQRVAIARALSTGPDLLVCDEPVSALDVSVQAQVLGLLARLRRELGLAMLFISHDLGVIRQVSDRVVVLSGGRVVEEGPVDTVFERPAHAYTRQLLAAMPRIG
ncbi:dipeptide ABC transporter ATP-binding protein [Amycolatopsis sp. lyj-23]|uniref:dipeptide ABC transporter ATP-binding protein n=1 Tax=Amycolatopsis sp. lyj-23 TaxID=2789283 RepID=UPI00397AB939